MGSDAPAPTATESTAEMMRAYTAGLPDLLNVTSQNILPVEKAMLEASQAVSPGYTKLQTDLYGTYGPELTRIGSELNRQNEMAQIATDTGALAEANKAGGLLDQAKAGQEKLDPEYYTSRALASSKLGDLLNSIDVNGLSGSERAEVSRSLARDNAATGNTDPSSLSTVSNAMTFGSALDKKRNSLMNALNTASQLAPTFKSGQDAFQMTTGRSGSANTGTGQFVGNTQTGGTATAMGNSLLGQVGQANSNAMNINANRRDTLDKATSMVGAIMPDSVGCCFIFMEAYDGLMPWWVRKCRDAFYTKDRRNGYVRCSKWLVPMMEKSSFIRQLVNDLMIAPLTSYGGYLFKVKGYEDGRKYQGYTNFWFKVWDIIGKL